jgi:hypothetical protein
MEAAKMPTETVVPLEAVGNSVQYCMFLILDIVIRNNQVVSQIFVVHVFASHSNSIEKGLTVFPGLQFSRYSQGIATQPQTSCFLLNTLGLIMFDPFLILTVVHHRQQQQQQ